MIEFDCFGSSVAPRGKRELSSERSTTTIRRGAAGAMLEFVREYRGLGMIRIVVVL